MKALSIKQPWAELILQERKTIEIRSWNTKFHDYFLIHAPKKPDMKTANIYELDLEQLLCGYIIGYAKLADVVSYNSESEFLRDKNKHLSISKKESYPLYGFILEDVHRIAPIKYKGKLGFFKVLGIGNLFDLEY